MKNQYTLYKLSLAAIVIIFLFAGCECRYNRQNTEKELLKTDSMFSVLSDKQGMKKAFLAYLDTSAVLIRQNRMPIEGVTSIKNYFSAFSDTSFTLTWKPLKARLSDENTMGFTYGIYEIAEKASGKLTGTGTYITIWQKKPDGKWKAVFDTGNEGLGKQ
jgi:hypothetical protein